MKNGIEILLINATSREQDIFSFALNDLHVSYTCRFAENMKDAIKKLNTIIPDYIFIDTHETKSNGFISSKQIKQISDLKHTQVILYTDYIDKSAAKALQFNECMCINKTATISDLIHILKEIFINRSIQMLNN